MEPDNTTDRLPYAVYAILAGLVLWFVLAAWGFAGAGYVDLSLAVVTVFFLIVMAIPFVLWRVWRANRDPKTEPDRRETFADWTAGTFETWQDRVKGSNAAAEIILPIAAAAFGMTAFAIVFHYVAAHAST
jgi:FtsH-binding integral membrane protein